LLRVRACVPARVRAWPGKRPAQRAVSRCSVFGVRAAGALFVVGVPPAVTGCAWTVRGRELVRCEGSLAGNRRCFFVSVCQSPVLAGALAAARPVPYPDGGFAAAGGGCA
jgi:hypothetical protein